ncbi:MAG: creatininase family protein [Planctomycetes bacterium]|nr:creatininase family protein [Planctomycetota bacterium]
MSEKPESTVPFADVRMELMSSRDIQQYQRRSDLVVLPVGCFEMHGPLVPLGCDSFIDWAMGLLLARQWECPCLPPIYYTFPGASGPWPGTVDIPNRATIDYVQAVVGALLKNGFKRVVVVGSHGPLAAMMQCVIRDVFQATGQAVLHVQPYGKLLEKMAAAGVPYGEPGVVLGSMKLLGLSGLFDPAASVDRPVEYPLPSIGPLRKCQAQMPWIFAKDYQHTGMNKELTAAHADRIAEAMAEAAAEMKDLPEHFTRYQREMADLYRDRPWARDDVWTETR